MPDAIFSDPRLAAVYDRLDPDRSDLDVYTAIAIDELAAGSVLDVGCGTGCFALLLAARGVDVVGVDPAAASLDVARSKPGAERVRWVHGDASTLPADLAVDAAFMTANVAQVFLTDESWAATLAAIHAALRAGGTLVFETRDPRRRAWEGWTREQTYRTAGDVSAWEQLLDVDGDLVTFETLTNFDSTGETLRSTSTLRFRHRSELERSLDAAGYDVVDVRDAPDRPGRELVFLARSPGLRNGPP